MPAYPANRNCLSLDELNLYHRDQLNAAEKHSVEDHLLSCPLCRSALEGYALMPFLPSDIPPVPAAATDSKGINWAAMLGLPLSLSIVLAVVFSLARPGDRAEKDIIPAPVTNGSSGEAPQDSADEGIYALTEKLNELVVKDPEVKKLVTEDVRAANDIQNFGQPDPSVWMMPQKEITGVSSSGMEEPVLKIQHTTSSRDTFIHDVLVTSYRELYYVDPVKYDEYLRSTDAKYETRNQKAGDKSPPELEYITSADILDKALENFSKNNFTDALKLFNILIRHEPDDVNALFYASVCYINLNRAEDAMEYLDRVIASPYTSFSEDAFWQKANAYVQLKQWQEAKNLLLKIVKEGGFYKDRAANLLKRVNAKIK